MDGRMPIAAMAEDVKTGADEGAGSKLAKAQELGLPILDADGFRRLLAGEEPEG